MERREQIIYFIAFLIILGVFTAGAEFIADQVGFETVVLFLLILLITLKLSDK